MFLYVIGTDGDLQKIGFSKNVEKRLKSLQTGNPQKLTIHHKEPVPEDRVRLLERKLHQELNYLRSNGEWFHMNSKDAVQLVQFAVITWLEDPTLR